MTAMPPVEQQDPPMVAVASYTWTELAPGVSVMHNAGLTIGMRVKDGRVEAFQDSGATVDLDLRYELTDEGRAALRPSTMLEPWGATQEELDRATEAMASFPPVVTPDEVIPPDELDRVPVSVAWPQVIDTTVSHLGDLPDIALSGAAGAGKDEAAKVLVEEYGYTVGKFARLLYEAVRILNPYDEHGNRVADRVDRQGWDVVKRNQPEVRRLLQVMGTEVGRGLLGQDVWVEAAAKWRLTVDGPVVWTDTRFPNEVAYVSGDVVMRHPLSQRGGLWVHIERPGQFTDLVGETATHASETSLPPTAEADYVLLNQGTVADLHQAVRNVMAWLDR